MVNSQEITVSLLPYEMRALCVNPLQHTMDLKWFFLFLSVTEKRSVSPTQSCVSMKSDASKDWVPPDFREGELPSEQRYFELLLLSHPHITYVLQRVGHIHDRMFNTTATQTLRMNHPMNFFISSYSVSFKARSNL